MDINLEANVLATEIAEMAKQAYAFVAMVVLQAYVSSSNRSVDPSVIKTAEVVASV